ncbi:unnamed protein product, partial [Ectocarpus sp. 8 AP-2014]
MRKSSCDSMSRGMIVTKPTPALEISPEPLVVRLGRFGEAKSCRRK